MTRNRLWMTMAVCISLYDLKLRLYQALLNRDTDEALRVTQISIDTPMSELASYIS